MRGMKPGAAGFLLVVVLLGGSIPSPAQSESQLPAGTTAQWWQYAISIPGGVNPLLDATGDNCVVGQRDPIWFLTGTLFGGTAKRTCVLPAGEWLFFPVINSLQVNTPGVCGQATSLSVAEMRSLAATLIDSVTSMSVEVDRKPVNNVLRIKSNVFATTFPDDNVFDPYCGGPGSVPPGVYSRSVDDGYYVLLKPLSAGKHTLQIDATSGSTVVKVTYYLTVCSPHQGDTKVCSAS